MSVWLTWVKAALLLSYRNGPLQWPWCLFVAGILSFSFASESKLEDTGLGNMTSNFSRRHVVRRQQVLVASERPACNGDDRRQLVLF